MNVELYCCYSLNLRNYLFKHGIKYSLCALNPNNQRIFWVYIKDEKLDELLTKWSNKEQLKLFCKILQEHGKDFTKIKDKLKFIY